MTHHNAGTADPFPAVRGYPALACRAAGNRVPGIRVIVRPAGDSAEAMSDTGMGARLQALAESEARFRAVANLVPDLLWSNDPAGRGQWYNQRWTDYTGQASAEAAGDGWLAVIHAEDRDATLARLRHAILTGEPLQREHRIRRKDGAYRWFLVRAEPVRDAGGAITQWFGAATDIHDQRTAAQALEDSERRLRSFAEASGNVLWIAEETGRRLKYLSPAFEQVFGTPHEAVMADLGRWAELVHPDDREAACRAMPAALRGERVEQEYRIVRPCDGAVRWIKDKSFPILGSDGRVCRIGGIAEDVTGRRDGDERQGLLIRELSHRVKNILAVIQTMVWQSGRRATGLADFLLRLESRLTALGAAHSLLTASHWESIRLGALVEVALAPHHGKGDGRIVVELGADPHVSPALAQDLVLGLHELATNAAKYGALSAPDGRVRLDSRCEGEDLVLCWRETDGPSAAPPTTEGFGTRLLRKVLGGQQGRQVAFDWRPEGLACIVRLTLGATPGHAEAPMAPQSR
jgi:PAS domain S-box-containing protein